MLIAGNWKMNGLRASAAELDAIIAGAKGASAEVLICPPFTLVDRFVTAAKGGAVTIGAQDCHAKDSGAHTGCVAAPMIADLGATHVIVGHSERRTDQKETDAEVKAKAEAALRAGLVAIVCVGETEAERDAGRAEDVVGGQIAGSLPAGATAANLVVAYEPVWAIGTGRTPSVEDVAAMHAFIRATLDRLVGGEGAGVRILYGGSVKASNAAELLAIEDVDGALVGGASLTAEQFLPIVNAAR
jgi:triosephosphate isomerase